MAFTWGLTALTLLGMVGKGLGFMGSAVMVPGARLARPSSGACVCSMRGDSPGDFEETEGTARILKSLITEQALSTATYYWLELRGNMYAEWLTRYVEGTGSVASCGWDDFLSGMMSCPPEEVVVKKLIKMPRGGSGTNPYLADRKAVEYTELIEPSTIARRIMEIREQVASHLSSDLQHMAAENAQLRRFYTDAMEYGDDAAIGLRLANFQPRVDRDMYTGSANPPYRARTYDKAIELVTEASVRRMRSELRVRGDRCTLSWLERFDSQDLQKRGNDLVQALMEGPMMLVPDSRASDRPRVIEPLRVASSIMRLRETVAQELTQVLEDVPGDHQRLTVLQLKKQWDMSPSAAEGGAGGEAGPG